MGGLSERGSIESRWILFRIEDRKFAIEASIVKEILSLIPLKPTLIGGPGFFATFPLRGNLIYAFDLRYYWGEKPTPYRVDDDLLLLDTNIAIPIHEVLEIREIEPVGLSDASAHFIQGEVVQSGEVISLLNSDELKSLSIDTQHFSSMPEKYSKMYWYEVATSSFSDLDRKLLNRRKDSNERIETSIQSDEMISLAVIESVDEKFCIPIEQILEFSDPGQITPMPGTPDELHGCMNLRGEVVPVLSLAILMGRQRKMKYTQGKIVLVKDDNLPVGILVDELLDVVSRKASSRILSNISGRYESGSMIEASFPEDDGSHLNVISLDSLFNRARNALKL